MLEINPDNQLIQALSAYVNEAILIIKAEDAQCLYASPLACQYLQSCASNLQENTLFEIDKELSDFNQWQAYVSQIQIDNAHAHYTCFLRDDRSELSVEIRANWIRFQGVESILMTVRDVSARHIYEEKVLEDKVLRTFTLREAQDGYWDWDLVENTLYLSPHCFHLMRINQNEVSCSVLEQWLNVIHPQDKKTAFQTIDNHVRGKTERFKLKYRLKQKGGEYIWVQGRGATVERDEDGNPTRILGAVIDITESESTTQNLLWHSQHDALTKVFNRKKGYEFFHEYLIQAQQSQRDGLPALFQIAVLDIDDFKRVNDQYGHLVGDALLQHFTDFVQSYIEGDMILARWGGEEFVLLSYGTRDMDFINLIDHLVKRYSSSTFKGDLAKPIHTSVSVGVACFKGEQDSIASLFKAADQAMYQAKAEGKNTFCLA
ncbi:diguanylate cyclase [Marinomonas sp. PE14-40]|uniref:GGDEF domain-containing protein n=1 Tax=Marinomonas sp. PE14-40 TaxID=3060621 RepID=UPI003F67DD4D